MANVQTFRSIAMPAPKLLSPYTALELAEALVYFAAALDETVDAIFLAQNDPKFLTKELAEDLRVLQGMAQIVAEAASIQTPGRVAV